MFVYVCVCAPMSCGMSFAALPLSSVSCVCVCQSLRRSLAFRALAQSRDLLGVSFGQNGKSRAFLNHSERQQHVPRVA